jgi:hypothetical protein
LDAALDRARIFFRSTEKRETPTPISVRQNDRLFSKFPSRSKRAVAASASNRADESKEASFPCPKVAELYTPVGIGAARIVLLQPEFENRYFTVRADG